MEQDTPVARGLYLTNEEVTGALERAGLCVAPNDMETKSPTAQERIATTADRLGTDAEGREHYWTHGGRKITVLDDGEIAHVDEDVDPQRWVAFIDEHVGWETCHHAGSLAELLEGVR